MRTAEPTIKEGNDALPTLAFEKSPDGLGHPPSQSLLSLLISESSDDSLSESSLTTETDSECLVDTKSAYLSDASWGFAASKKKESLTSHYCLLAEQVEAKHFETAHWVDVHSHMIW